ncbi:type I secretion system permease/ATPase [Leptothrix ochracea]|uniref:type I secretion system permease/ATPase n=1 Tax=Leptothrix ochracea TaxID=735331 RepID=UPI0034E1FF52
MTDTTTNQAPPLQPHAVPPNRLREDLIHPDPLLDCLLEVCRLHGVHASRASLSAGLPMKDGRLPLAMVERAAARVGMVAKLQRQKDAIFEVAVLPVIMLMHGDEACVFLGFTPEGDAQVLLPESGQGTVLMPWDDLMARYTGLTLFVRPQLNTQEHRTHRRPRFQGHWFWSAIFSQRGVYQDILWAALLINLFGLAFPIFTMNVYDRVVPNHGIETLWALSIGLFITLLADLYMRKLRSRFIDEASARIDVRLSAVLMERVLGMRMADRPASVGSFASNLRGFEQVRDFIATSTVTALVDLPFGLLFLLVLAWISPWLLLPVIVAFVLIVGSGYVLQYRLHELSQGTYAASAQRNATLVEALGGIESIKTQRAEGVIQARWERINTHLALMTVRMRSLSSQANYGTQWLMQMVSLVVIIIGVYLISKHDLTLGALIAGSTLASRALTPAGQIVSLLLQYQTARTALESLNEMMERPTERETGQTFLHRQQLRGEIEFRDVHFSYPNRDDSAVSGVSFRIQPGEKVALIGRIGSGKSTLQKLMLGLYTPQQGAVLIDGIDLRQLDPADIRANIGYVGQDVTLFLGNLRDNITFGMPHADDRAILAAAETAGVSDWVHQHPRGYDMPVGERGELLSGGQRQGVGIARAVLHNASMLLLDEPTSAMDFSTEAQVTQRLSHFAEGKTVVLVTHRTSMLSMVNRLIVVDGGRILADGPRDKVIEALQAGRIARSA